MSFLSDEEENVEVYDDDDFMPSDQMSDMMDDAPDEESEAWSEEELEDTHDATDVDDYG